MPLTRRKPYHPNFRSYQRPPYWFLSMQLPTTVFIYYLYYRHLGISEFCPHLFGRKQSPREIANDRLRWLPGITSSTVHLLQQCRKV